MKEKIINLLGIRPNGVTICRIDGIKDKGTIVMEAITEQQENRIDNSKAYYGNIRFERYDGTIVQAEDIYLYGELDFDKGNFTTIDGIAKQFQTWDALKWFKYCHILIGKPKRIIVYKRHKRMK